MLPAKPCHVKQTRFGPDDGNCLEACIASMLCCDIEAVPRNTEPNTNMRPYLDRLGPWLGERGLRLVVLDGAEVRACTERLTAEGTYWIATLRTGLPYTHAVVLRGSTPEWEPHGAEPWPTEPLALIDIGLLIEREPIIVEDRSVVLRM